MRNSNSIDKTSRITGVPSEIVAYISENEADTESLCRRVSRIRLGKRVANTASALAISFSLYSGFNNIQNMQRATDAMAEIQASETLSIEEKQAQMKQITENLMPKTILFIGPLVLGSLFASKKMSEKLNNEGLKIRDRAIVKSISKSLG